MDFRRILKFLILLLVVGTIIFIVIGIRKKGDLSYDVESLADGVSVTFSTYNEENRKSLTFKYAESYLGRGDRIIMKKVEGLIYKEGKMNKDIRFFGDEGYVENNKYNFYIEKNARITSDDFVITSAHFLMKDQAELSSAPHVEYKTETMQGSAEEGMGFYVKVNTLKFYKTKGTYKKDDKVFNYKADVLWFIDEEKVMVMENDALIRDENSILRSEWVTMHFDEEAKHLRETTSQKNSYLFIKDPEKQETREIKSQNIRSLYDAEGRLTQLTVITDAEILLKNPENRAKMSSDTIDMYFDPLTGNGQKVVIPSRGIVENRGKTKFRVIADTIEILYDSEGKLNYCEGNENVRFRVQQYKGTTQKISYNIKKNNIHLEGPETNLINGSNTFYSSSFKIDTEEKEMSSAPDGVKSVIKLEKDNVLFSKESIFINARKVRILEKQNKFVYERKVNLNQGDVAMEAENLDISEEGLIKISGKVNLSFKNGGKDMTLKGNKLEIDSKNKTIKIDGRAAIKSDETFLTANSIDIRFNENNEIDKIDGKDSVNFLKDDLTGYSNRVEWNFKEDLMVLRGKPRIQKEGGGKTTGKVLQIDVKTGKITILSTSSDRTETIIR